MTSKTSKTSSLYVKGYDRGIRDARAVLGADPVRAPRLISSRVPLDFRDRAEWLDGYTQGVRRVTLDARQGKPWQAGESGY